MGKFLVLPGRYVLPGTLYYCTALQRCFFIHIKSTKIKKQREKMIKKAIGVAVIIATSLLGRTNAEFLPKKSWPVIGYEVFHGKKVIRKDDSAKNDRSKVAVQQRQYSTQAKTQQKSGSSSDGSFAKKVMGLSIAAVIATIGGKALADGEQPERALVEALSKPVIAMRSTTTAALKNPRQFNTATITTEGASIPNEVFNLVKAIVGVGVLSLPAGVAAFGSAPSAFIPAGILIAVIGCLSAYGFALTGKVCAYTGAKSYREAWSRSVGPGSSWIPAWSVTFKTFLACLAFSMVLADTFSSLLESTRNTTLLVVTGVILLPLCLLKNLKSLAPFSLLGVMGMAYTALAMTVRYFDGSYAISSDGSQGKLVEQIASSLRPKFGNMGADSVLSPNALILVCMLSTAYMVRFFFCSIFIIYLYYHT